MTHLEATLLVLTIGSALLDAPALRAQSIAATHNSQNPGHNLSANVSTNISARVTNAQPRHDTDKPQRQAAHREAGSEQKGLNPNRAAARAGATVSKPTSGGRQSGAGRRPAKRPGEGTLK